MGQVIPFIARAAVRQPAEPGRYARSPAWFLREACALAAISGLVWLLVTVLSLASPERMPS